MELPKISVRPDTLPTLMNGIKTGQMQVPRFQRDFVWPLSKTRSLLDSMFKEFPIGTFFLWNAPANSPLLSRPLPELDIPEPQIGASITYILDGQQRLTSLYCVLNGIQFGSRDYGRISIDLEAATKYLSSHEEDFSQDIFVYKSGDGKQYISVQELTGMNHLSIYSDIPTEWKNAFTKAYTLFTTYPFSVVWIQDQLLGNAIEIFQRINQSGKPLSRFDLVCANVWKEDFDFRKEVSQINRTFEDKGFGSIDGTIFTQIFSLINSNQCTTAAELSLTTEQIQSTWKKAIQSLGVAIDYLVHNLGVARIDYLPYRGLLVVLTYFFYHSNSNISVEDRDIIWSWFWRTTLSERYSATSPTRMAEDAKILLSHLKGENVSFHYQYKVTGDAILRTKMTSTSSALRNATLCMLVLKSPRNFKDNSIVNIKDQFFSNIKQAERHHIFPVGFLKTINVDPKKVNLLANFCFIPANLNKEIGSRPPSDYFPSYMAQNPNLISTAKGHFLPIDNEQWINNNDFFEFLKLRSELLADGLNQMVLTGQPDLHLQAPVFADSRVAILEINLRNFIDRRLSAIMGENYWKGAIPSDINDFVKGRIQEHLSRHAYISESEFSGARKKLDFCDVSHYKKIILKNWQLFEEFFQRKDELSKHLNAFRVLRNSIQHNREPSDIEERNGDAGILWLSRILDSYENEENEFEKINGDEIEV